MTEQELHDHMRANKRSCGYAELTRDVEMSIYQGYWEDRHAVMRPYLVRAGITVKPVMASRLGDLGITCDLDATVGYRLRVTPGVGYLTNCRLERDR